MKDEERQRPLHPRGTNPEVIQTSNFKPHTSSAWKYARQIAFPRLAGRAGERDAADFIAGTFKSFGYEVETDPFPVWATPWGWMRIGLSICLILLIAAGSMAERAPLLTALCCALLFVVLPVWTRLWARRAMKVVSGAPPLFMSSNLIAACPDASAEGLTVYLLAHYDSKSQTLSIRWRILLIIAMIAGTGAFGATHLLIGLYPGFYALPGAALSMWGATVLWAASVAAGLVLSGMRTENRSPGGLDNAGSVGALLALAETLRERQWKRINLTFVAVGAEELGLLGSMWLARRLRASLDPARTWALNLDGIGVRGSLRLIEGAQVWRTADSPFARLLRQTADRLGIPLKPMRMLPGFLLDHIPFSRAGFQATSLIAVSERGWKIHTPDDTIALVEPAGLAEAVALIDAALEALDGLPIRA